MSGKFMIRKKPFYIPKGEIIRDYRTQGDLDPTRIIFPCEFKEYEVDGDGN